MRHRWTRPALAGVLLFALLLGGRAPWWTPSPLRRTVTVGLIPWQVVVDQRTRRAFILTAQRTANTLSLLDTATGALVRTVPLGGTPWFDSVELQYGAAPLAAVDEATQRVFVATQGLDGQGTLGVFDARSGTRLRSVRLGLWLRQTAAIGVDAPSQRVVVVGQGMDGQGHLSLLDARSGALLRTRPLALDPVALAVDARAQRVVVTSSRGSIAVLDARTGTLLHTVALAAAGGQVIVDPQSTRAVVSDPSQGLVHLLDTRTGQELGRMHVPGGVSMMALDARTHRVFILGPTSARVSVLDTRRGALVGHIAVGVHPTAVAVDQRTDQVVVTAVGSTDPAGHVRGYGTLSVLDGRTLTVQQTVSVGVAPADVAVEEGQGHTLVVNSAYNPPDCTLAVVPAPQVWWAAEAGVLQQRLPWLPLPVPAVRVPPSTGSVDLLDTSGA